MGFNDGSDQVKEADKPSGEAEEKARAEFLESGKRVLQQQREESWKHSGTARDLPELQINHPTDDSSTAQVSARLQRGSDGRVSHVEYPDGRTSDFHYGADGQLDRLTYKDGSSWRKDGATWHLYDKDGRLTPNLPDAPNESRGKFEVDQNGDFIFTENGIKTTEGPNGSVMVQRPDGKPMKITYPDGRHSEFHYGPDGQLDRLTYKEGSSWRKDGATWHLYDKDGKLAPNLPDAPNESRGKFEVDQHGNFIFTGNGIKTTEGPDGSVLVQLPNGKPMKITYPNGEHNEFHYGPDGQLDRLTYKDGYSWRKDGAAWHLYEQDGKLAPNRTDAPNESKGKFEVDQNGNFIFTDVNGRRDITHPDGTVSH